MSKFHLIDRDIDFLLPPSVQEWLPEGHRRATWLRWWKGWT